MRYVALEIFFATELKNFLGFRKAVITCAFLHLLGRRTIFGKDAAISYFTSVHIVLHAERACYFKVVPN